MTDACSGPVRRPATSRGRWTSFVAAIVAPGRRSRALCEQGNSRHRVRVEHDGHTLLVHISDEDGSGWTTLAIDRATRAWSLAQRERQLDAASVACASLYAAAPPTRSARGRTHEDAAIPRRAGAAMGSSAQSPGSGPH